MFLNSSIMMMLASFIFLLILVHVSGTLYGPRHLLSRVGGSVNIKCYYSTTPVNKHDRKYWCKEAHGRSHCQTIISTTGFSHKDYEGRVSIKDIRQTGVLQVMMTQLEKKDSSNYRCGIGKNDLGLYAGVHLTVSEGPTVPKSPKMLWGKLKGSVTIYCPPESVERSKRQILCKLKRSRCSVIVDSNSNRGNKSEGRMVITSEGDSKAFKISINKLRREDSGMYMCGTGRPGTNATIIQLQVVEESVFSNVISNINVTSEPQTTGISTYGYDIATYEYVTTGKHKERFSKPEPNLLSIVLPVLIILSILAATVVIVLVKIRRQRMLDISTIAARNPRAEIPLTDQNCAEEHPKEENRSSTDEQESAVDPGKEVPTTSVYCLVSSVPSPEDSRENDYESFIGIREND